MAQSQSPLGTYSSMSWEQKINFAQWVTFFPALTAMVFMRRKVGFRVVKPTYLFSMAALLLLLAYFAGMGTPFFPQSFNDDGTPTFPSKGILLTIFAVAMLAFGLVQRFLRRVELGKPGVRWHTRTTGISYFAFLPLNTYIINRFIDPAVCFLIGLLLSFVSHPLGAWLIFSAACWGMHEQITYDKSLELTLDILDGMVDSEVQAQVAEHSRGAGPGAASVQPLSMEDTAGIPTGLAPDITRKIEDLRERNRVVNSNLSASAPAYSSDVTAASTSTQPDFTTPGSGGSSDQSPLVTVVPEAAPVKNATENADEPLVRRAPDNLA